MMKHSFKMALCLILFPVCATVTDAQVPDPEIQADTLVADTLAVPEGFMLADTVVYRQTARVDSSLVGKSIFNLLPVKSEGGNADVFVYQSGILASAMKSMAETNRTRQIPGFRVRIFSDNRQSARIDAENTMKAFVQKYPDVPAYISYANPYFKVTVGDFRTRSEAMSFMREILSEFQKAFIVKEGISYPAIDKENAVVADTVLVLKPKPLAEQTTL